MQGRQRHRKSGTAHNFSDEEALSQHPNGCFGKEKTLAGVEYQCMVGPELGRETDAIAESVLLIIWSARKVVRPKPDQPDRRRRHWYACQFSAEEKSYCLSHLHHHVMQCPV